MESLFPLAIVVLSSGGCYLVGRRIGGCTRRGLWAAVRRVLECLGMSAMCFVLNMGLGMGLILAVRSVTPWFVFMYLADDVSLLALSLLQGLTLCLWWHGGQGDSLARIIRE
jgi:hypothetical protein